ncbi:MAG: TetR/AcrR family transcriptional regulator [Parasphingorhabdus sp.]
MKARSHTAQKILEAARKAFNLRGYASTSVTEIASELGMSQGNLTYHFPTKRDLAMALENDLLQMMRDRKAKPSPGPIAQDYVEHLMFGMELTWRYRFVMRDRTQYAGGPIGTRDDSELLTDFDELVTLLKRAKKEKLFLANSGPSIDVLARSLWIVSRYWIDYLRELEGLKEISWADQERGIQHHFAVLLPCLKVSARREFQAALTSASEQSRLHSYNDRTLT